MPITVDTNHGEEALHSKLVSKFGAAEVGRRRLDVGDVLLEVGGKRIIVERKTLFDLAKSLTDGRYSEQKARMVAASAAYPDYAKFSSY